jgi:hypothetical protein
LNETTFNLNISNYIQRSKELDGKVNPTGLIITTSVHILEKQGLVRFLPFFPALL